jgi:uncharacterized protein (TIGR02001 family)
MKKIALTLAVFAAGYSAQAADATVAAPKPAYTVTTDFTYASEYVFRGQKQSNSAFQASAEVGYTNFYAGVWTNQPLRNEANEVDLYLGYSFPLQNDWKIDAGVTSYNYAEGTTLAGKSGLSTYETYLGLTGGSISGFTPSVYGYYDWKLDNYTLQASVGYSLPVKQIGTSLDFAVTYGYSANTGRYFTNKAPGSYWGAGVTVPYKLAPNATLTGGLQYAGNDEDTTAAGFGEHYKLYYTIGLTLGF